MEKRIFGEWDTVQEIERSFREPGCLEGCEILYACYDKGSYEGSAEVIYRGPDEALYEVASSHCSCHGLEDRWSPGLVTVEALQMRPDPRNNLKYSGLTKEEIEALCLARQGL